MLRDIMSGEDLQVQAVAGVIAQNAPDILVLQGIDYDHDLITLRALRDVIAGSGWHYPYIFALRPNTGRVTGVDIDADGRLGEPEDNHGYGWFAGEGGMAILSIYPIVQDEVQDLSALRWADLPEALLPEGTYWAELGHTLRLSTVGHWVVPIELPTGPLYILTFHASTPVFDGPEDRNGRRNHDEILFWQRYLDGAFGPVPDARFVIAGDANLDPYDGEGRKAAIQRLLSDPRLADPKPRRSGTAIEAYDHQGDSNLDTVAWADPGHLRVSYVLPSSDLDIVDAGVYWPPDGSAELDFVETASRHRLVWVDVKVD